jgi:predicted nucleic acid-binding protein
MDTNVIVAGLRSSRGASFRVLRGVRHRAVRPVVTVPVFLEYEDVLRRPGLLPSHMPGPAVLAFLNSFLSLAECREVHFRWRPWLEDPKDDSLLEAAFSAGGIPIVTHNLRHFRAAGRLGIRIMTPNHLVRELNLP